MFLGKGDAFERLYSKKLHAKGLPMLISTQVLRERGLGQIDVACIEKHFTRDYGQVESVLHIYEIKSHNCLSKAQRQRIMKTQDFLSRLLGLRSSFEVKFCQKVDHSLFF